MEAGSGNCYREEAVVRVWDLESGEVRILDAGDAEPSYGMKFTHDGNLWVSGGPSSDTGGSMAIRRAWLWK